MTLRDRFYVWWVMKQWNRHECRDLKRLKKAIKKAIKKERKKQK